MSSGDGRTHLWTMTEFSRLHQVWKNNRVLWKHIMILNLFKYTGGSKDINFLIHVSSVR